MAALIRPLMTGSSEMSLSASWRLEPYRDNNHQRFALRTFVFLVVRSVFGDLHHSKRIDLLEEDLTCCAAHERSMRGP